MRAFLSKSHGFSIKDGEKRYFWSADNEVFKTAIRLCRSSDNLDQLASLFQLQKITLGDSEAAIQAAFKLFSQIQLNLNGDSTDD